MGEDYLIDTNAVIDFLANRFPSQGMDFVSEIIDRTPLISVITRIELLGFNAPANEEALLKEFVNDSVVLGLSEPVVEKCISLRKQHSIKLPDALIAATALVHKLHLITRNITDFQSVSELTVSNPHEL